jgi:hypothetical protein
MTEAQKMSKQATNKQHVRLSHIPPLPRLQLLDQIDDASPPVLRLADQPIESLELAAQQVQRLIA